MSTHGVQITGDADEGFLELQFLSGGEVDADSPVFVRRDLQAPDFF
jgi:hypothetical protein